MSMSNKKKLLSISKKKLLQRLTHRLYFVRKETSDLSQWFLCKTDKIKAFNPQFLIATDLMTDFFSQGILEEEEINAPLSTAGRTLIRRLLLNDGEFLGQHQFRCDEILLQDGIKKQVLIDHKESPLSWLAKRKSKNGRPLLDKHQFASGERLRATFEKSQMSPNITLNWDRLTSSLSKHDKNSFNEVLLSDAVLTAKQNYYAALDAVGPELSGILVDICCEHRGLEDAEKRNGWPKRSGKIILSMALTRLARYYGFISPPSPKINSIGKISHWGSKDYRPNIDSLDG